MTKIKKQTILKTIQMHKTDYLSNHQWVEENDGMTEQEIKNILLDKEACDKFLGTSSLSPKRYSLPDFYFDLAEQIHPVEVKLIEEGLLEPEHYFYQEIQKKNKVIQLENQTNLHTTVMYAQYHCAEHWNKASKLSKKDIDEIIFRECVELGEPGYKILTKIFSQENFKQATHKSYLNENETINLKEALTYRLLSSDIVFSGKKFDKNFFMLKALEPINFDFDFSKIFTMRNYNKIKYFNLSLEPLKHLADIEVQYSFSDNNIQTLSLLTVSKLNLFYDGAFKLYEGKDKNIFGLDGKNYDNLEDFLKTFIEDSETNKVLSDFIKSKAKFAFNPKVKEWWTFVNLSMITPEKNYVIKKQKI